MKKLFSLLVLIALLGLACSKKGTNSSYRGTWTGQYFADNIYYGTWNIIIDDHGGVTGKIVSAPVFQSYEFFVVGTVSTSGSIQFIASISPTIEWKFQGSLNGSLANGTWEAESIPGNPPNKVWSGNRQ